MFEHCWAIVLRGRMLRGLDPLYLAEIVSHRHLRYASGLLHLAAARRERRARSARARSTAPLFAGQLAFLGARGRYGPACRATTCSSPGRPSRRSRATFAPACRRSGRKRRGRGDADRGGALAGARVPARPLARSSRAARRSSASTGHEYPFVDGIPVLVRRRRDRADAAGLLVEPGADRARPRARSRRRSRATRSTRTSPS